MSWIIFTIAATILQTFRNLEQKSLNKKLDTLTVSWSRFILPLPFAFVVVLSTFDNSSNWFIFYCLVAALFQIGGNAFLLKTIYSKNFGVGIAFYKTEVLQSLLFGVIFFAQQVSTIAVVAIIITSIGMILMSNFSYNGGVKKFLQSVDKAALFGALSGSCFCVSSFSIKFASQEFTGLGYGYVEAAIVVLMWVILAQNFIFVAIKSVQNRLVNDLKSLFAAENKMSFVKTGCLSFAGSLCWFSAYAIGNVIYVKAVGQLELVIAVAISYFYLKEKHRTSEFVGIILTLLGILTLILFSNQL